MSRIFLNSGTLIVIALLAIQFKTMIILELGTMIQVRRYGTRYYKMQSLKKCCGFGSRRICIILPDPDPTFLT
jgi:hypothetical protein